MSKSQVDPVEIARRHAIEFQGPAVEFFEGALLGNGGLGAVVTTRPDAVVIRFGHNNVWDIRIWEENSEKIGTFQEVFERVKEIRSTLSILGEDPWYREYVHITTEAYRKHYPRPLPCGSLLLGFDRRKAEVLGHRVDISSGVCEVRFLKEGSFVFLEIFADVGRDRLWMRLRDEQGRPAENIFNRMRLLPDPETPRDLPPRKAASRPEAGMLAFEQVLPFEVPERYDKERGHPKDRAFRLSARAGGLLGKRKRLVNHYQYYEMGELEADPSAIFPFVACAQLDEGLATSLSAAPVDLPEVSWQRFEERRAAGEAAWAEYWSRSGVALEDEFLERVWYRNLYFFNCAVREGVTCPGLFANWTYRGIGTAWHGAYHLNYNTQQPFWVAFSSNRVEKHFPYVDLVDHLLPLSRKWAREYYGLRGACFPHTAAPVEMNQPFFPVPTWGWEICETPWVVQSLWWHYRYTLDEEFLRRRAFEPMKEAVLFLVDYLTRPEAHGSQWGDDLFHVFPTVPPELYGLMPGFRHNYDCLPDVSLIRFLFRAFVEACRILGAEESERELLARVREILPRLPDYPKAETPIGPVYVAAPGEDPEVVYNCPASTFTVFPAEEHGLHSDPETYRTALNTYRYQRNEGGNDLVLLNMVGARLGALDLEKFKRQIAYCMMPNGSCADKVLEVDGRYHDDTPFEYMARAGVWFENFALPAVINECLMQSYTGEIRLFPNWPKEKAAEFRTLRAVGGFLVSARFAGGAVEWVEVLSEKGSTLRLINPWEGEASCRFHDGSEAVLSGAVIELPTKPGDRLLFTPGTKRG